MSRPISLPQMVEPAPPPEPRRSIRGFLVLLVVLVLLGTAAAGTYLWTTGASGPSVPVSVDIPKGSTAGDVGDILDQAGVIRSSLAFRIAAGLRGIGDEIQAGTYRLRTNMPLGEALDALEAGPIVETVGVTFPEGLRLDEVAAGAAEALKVDPEELVGAGESGTYALPPYLPEGTATVEGFLFPKTYDFDPEEADPDAVIRRLLEQFETEAAALDWRRAKRLGLTRYEVVIAASMIEREARVPRDQAKIAAVIYNRLRKGIALQIDATVQYALPEHKESLTVEDYRYPSPYNTYLQPGLPPTPIASPGLASLRAALRPARANYLYYVVIDESGRHAFTDSYREFLRLKERAERDG